LIAILHVYILVLEMFLWDKPYGLKAFGNTLEKAQLTKVLAQNQGLYNGFLAAGLFWSLLAPTACAVAIANFFLGCVLVAGIYGGLTASKKIIYIQAVPALITLIVVNLF
jgi:putative membrane protein